MCVSFEGIFNLSVGVSSLFFIGCHLVALSKSGKFGVWHATTQNWQVSMHFELVDIGLNRSWN